MTPTALDGADSFEIDLLNHGICLPIPAGSRIDGVTFDLPGGMLVAGAIRGKVHCATGSIIILNGGEFQGEASALNIIVAKGGRITSLPNALSTITARVQVGEYGKSYSGVIALGAGSSVNAKLRAASFDIRRHAVLNSSILETI